MKKKTVFMILSLSALIVFSFAGCRDLRNAASDAASKVKENSTVSAAVSKAASAGEAVQSGVSGVVSDVVSKAASAGEAVQSGASGVVSNVVSQLTSG